MDLAAAFLVWTAVYFHGINSTWGPLVAFGCLIQAAMCLWAHDRPTLPPQGD